jgi:hypothetical protein
MDNFFDKFEGDVCELFKLFKEARREEIINKLKDETAGK